MEIRLNSNWFDSIIFFKLKHFKFYKYISNGGGN